MAIMQAIFADDELSFRLENNEVGVAAFCNGAFARVAASQLGGLLRHPPGKINQSEIPSACLGPHNGQR